MRIGTLAKAALLSSLCGAGNAAETLTFDVSFNDTVLASGTEGLAIGDRFILADKLLSSGAEAGYSSGLCTITDVQGIAICNVTFVFPDGSLSLQFVNSPPPEKHFAILGGTGRHQGARGAGVLIENGDGTGRVTFDIE